MKLFRVTIAEGRTYRQFVCDIPAINEKDAREKAMQAFFREHFEFSAHCRVIMCNEILYV